MGSFLNLTNIYQLCAQSLDKIDREPVLRECSLIQHFKFCVIFSTDTHPRLGVADQGHFQETIISKVRPECVR